MDSKNDNLSYDVAKEEAIEELVNFVKGMTDTIPAVLDKKVAAYFRAGDCDHPIPEHKRERCSIASFGLYVAVYGLLDTAVERAKAKEYLDQCADRNLLALLDDE